MGEILKLQSGGSIQSPLERVEGRCIFIWYNALHELALAIFGWV